MVFEGAPEAAIFLNDGNGSGVIAGVGGEEDSVGPSGGVIGGAANDDAAVFGGCAHEIKLAVVDEEVGPKLIMQFGGLLPGAAFIG